MRKTPVAIAAITLCALMETTVAGWAAGDSAQAEAAVLSSVKPSVDNHTIAGAVLLVARQNDLLSEQAVGYSDVAAKKLMRVNDLFRVASNTKQMTAAALMMLVDEGKVSLDDPIEKYLPEFKGQMILVESDAQHKLLKAPAHPPTVREALSHTSGFIHDNPFASALNVGTLAQRATVVGLEPLDFEPGSKFEYGNGNYEAAGRIIEVVSGMPYEKFLQSRLFDPLGMKDTTFWLTRAQQSHLARSYVRKDDGATLEAVPIPISFTQGKATGNAHPAGGMFSTADDLLRFARMMMAGGVYHGRRLLSETSVRALTSTQSGTTIDPAGDFGYGLGWFTEHKDSGQALAPGAHSVGWFNHSGAFGTYVFINPKRHVISILMMQQVNWLPGGVGRDQLISNFAAVAAKEYGRD